MPMGITARTTNPFDFDIAKVGYYLFLFFTLFILIDPFYTGYGAFRVTREIGPLKYTSLLFGFGAFFFALVGMILREPWNKQPPWRENLVTLWPFLIFALYMLTGSLVARIYFDIQETFLPFAIGMVGIPLAIVLFWSIDQHMIVARRFFLGLLLVLPIVIGWVVVKRLEDGQAFHTEIFLFVPLGAYFFLSLKRRWLAWGVLISVTFLAVFSYKNTAFLVLLVTLGYLLILRQLQRTSSFLSFGRVFSIYYLVIALIVAAAGISFLLLNHETYLPTGNVSVRTYTYGVVFDKFLNSPLYGAAFAGNTLVDLLNISILNENTLNTHSDLLDILAHGGIIGAIFFVYGFYRLFLRVISALKTPAEQDVKAVLHGLIIIVTTGLITAAFNSPFISLSIGVMFWFAVGLLVATSEYAHQSVNQNVK